LILRFYEWMGRESDIRVIVPGGATSGTRTNLMEKPEGTSVSVFAGREITLHVHPYEIVTERVNYPVPHVSRDRKEGSP
jgi:alpha-mannosidase